MRPLNADSLNRTIFISDNLPFLKSLDSASVDLVCIDPPFGKNETFSGNLRPADSPLASRRAQLISKGMTWSPSRGDAAFTVPMFDEFMRRIMSGDD